MLRPARLRDTLKADSGSSPGTNRDAAFLAKPRRRNWFSSHRLRELHKSTLRARPIMPSGLSLLEAGAVR